MGGQRDDSAPPPDFNRLFNIVSTKGQLMPTNYYLPSPGFFDLPPALITETLKQYNGVFGSFGTPYSQKTYFKELFMKFLNCYFMIMRNIAFFVLF